MSKRDAVEFVVMVGEALVDYADGDGDRAHDVLDRIQERYLEHWELPEVDDE